MDVETALVADGEPSESVYPGEVARDDPAMAAKFLAAVDAAPRDAGLDAASLAGAAATAMVVALVGVQLVRAMTWPSAPARHRWDGVEKRLAALPRRPQDSVPACPLRLWPDETLCW